MFELLLRMFELQADFSRKYSEINPVKKLDWSVTDERILFERVRHCWGPPYTGGPGQTTHVAPPSAALQFQTFPTVQ